MRHSAEAETGICGACYHVINRGNCRRDLFRGKGMISGKQHDRRFDMALSRMKS